MSFINKLNFKKRWPWLLLLIPVVAVVCVVVSLMGRASISSGELERLLSADGDATIYLDGDVKLSNTIVVNGNKTIVGKGTLLLVEELSDTWSEDGDKENSWGIGCTKLELKDTENMSALFEVSEGSTLTIGEQVVIDAGEKDNAVRLLAGGELIVSDEAMIKHGRYANVLVDAKASLEVKGGTIADALVHGVINKGSVTIEEGTLSGGKKGAILYNQGVATQTGGTIKDCKSHNVYVDAGIFTMTGGVNDNAAKDAIAVAEGAEAKIENGVVSNCDHGICNKGNAEVGKITLSECGIMNNKGGTLLLNDTTVDTTEVYCLANNGGTVTANNFTAARCDTCAIYNFSGDMILNNVLVTGSREGNIANAAGNLTVNGGTLEKCNDKSVVVGNGVATFNNVTLAGTSREKYGVYVFGGKTYINDSVLHDMSSTAFKIDVGGYIELKNIVMMDIAQNAFHLDGGVVLADNITMKNLGSHGVYNNGGEITLTNATMNGIKKNAIQQKDGVTTVSKLEADEIGNNGGYIEKGTLLITESSFANLEGNGFYLVRGESELTLKEVAIDTTGGQGINNASKVNLENVAIENTGKNGVFNQTNGVIEAKNVTIENAGEHGINNVSEIKFTDVKIIGSANEKNCIQNTGKAELISAVLKNSRNHGIYNTGTIIGKDITINDTVENGIYNASGNITVNGLSVESTGEHGINNEATLTAVNIMIAHTGAEKNCIQNAGTIDVTEALLKESKNHGIYNTGKLVGTDITVTTPVKNGIYNNKGTVTSLDGFVVTNPGNHGISNSGTFNGSNIEIDTTVHNGIYNSEGSFVVDKATISNTGEHGVNNNGVMTITNSVITAPGNGKNGIQNMGTMMANDIVVKDAVNHGIYNTGELNSTGHLSLDTIEQNGIYNYGGKVDLEELDIMNTGSHGINNTGEFVVEELVISQAETNSIQNSGYMKVSKEAVIKGSGMHGLYNSDTFIGNNIFIENVGDLGLSNAGDVIIVGLDILGKANKAVYNNGYAEFTEATIDGAEISNTGAEYLIDNNGGILDLQDTTIKNAKGTAIHNRAKASTSVTNVVINKAGNYGVFIEAGSSLSGDGFEINNITKGFDGAEGMPIKNAGKISMLDHVTIGSDAPHVTGSGTQIETTITTIVNNAIVNDDASASYSGYDLVVNNAVNGCAIYNKGKVFVTDLLTNKVKDGLATRYNSWMTLAGAIEMTDVSRNPITTYGPEAGNYKNGITLITGATMSVDGAGSHGINNKGSFLAAPDTKIALKNIVGENINAINNNKGTMTLGDVVIDGIYTTITMHDESTINSNAGNGIQTSGRLTIDGHVTISNIFYEAANGKTDNANGSGIVVKNGGSIDGNGGITILGSKAKGDYEGLYNGIFTMKSYIDLKGDIVIDTAKNQGVYIADALSGLTAGNIIVSNVEKGHGVYVNNANGSLTTTGDVTITDMFGGRGLYCANGTMNIGGDILVSGSANNGIETSGKIIVAGNVVVDMKDVIKQGIYVNGANASLSAKNISVNHAGENAIYINNAKGKLTSLGTISVIFPGKRGISNSGVIEANNIVVSDLTGEYGSYYPIENSGTITANGDVTIERVIDAAGIRNKGTITVNGTTTIKDISGSKVNGIQQDGGKIMNLNDLVISNISSEIAGENYCNGIHNKGTINLHGTATITNITNEAASTDTEGCGIVNAEKGRTITGNGKIVIANVQKYGIYNLGIINMSDISVTDAGANGIQNLGTLNANGDLSVLRTLGMGIYNEGEISAVEVSVFDTTKDAVDNKKNLKVSGTISIVNSGAQGLYIHDGSAKVEAKNVTVKNVVSHAIWINNGLGKLTVEEDITIDHVSEGRGLYTRGTVTAKRVNVSNTSKAAIRMDAHNSGNGNITVTEDIVVKNTSSEQGIYLNGKGTTLTVRNILVNDAASDGVKNNKGTYAVTGTVTVDGKLVSL